MMIKKISIFFSFCITLTSLTVLAPKKGMQGKHSEWRKKKRRKKIQSKHPQYRNKIYNPSLNNHYKKKHKQNFKNHLSKKYCQ